MLIPPPPPAPPTRVVRDDWPPSWNTAVYAKAVKKLELLCKLHRVVRDDRVARSKNAD